MALPEDGTCSVYEEVEHSDLQSMVGSDSVEPVETVTENAPGDAPMTGADEAEVQQLRNAILGEVQQSNVQSVDTGEPLSNLKRKKASENELNGPSNPMWKTSLCSYFRRQNGNCSHGDTCRYAHGESELRSRPDNSWDPTSERAKKLQKSESGEGIELPPDAREDLIPSLATGEESVDVALDRCLVHLPRKWASDKLKNFLDTQEILYKTAKKKKGMIVGFVSFETTEQASKASEELEGKSIDKKEIRVANVLPRSFEKKAKLTNVPNDQVCIQSTEKISSAEDHVVDESGIRTRSAREVVTPLADMSYSDQLEHKKTSLFQTLKRLTRNARKACPDGISLPEWILLSREIGGLPCKFEGILESPVVNGYRNKCEFSVGYSRHGKRTVGFMLGNFREGMTAIEEPVNCPNVSRIACEYALIFQQFLQSSSVPVWNRIDNVGFWRQFTVREGRSPGQSLENGDLESHTAEVMLIVQVCSSGVDNEVVESEFRKMAQSLAQGASACSPPLPLTALIVQEHQGISNAAAADCPLHPLPIPKVERGLSNEVLQAPVAARIHDSISRLCFSISPTAFFQVNTLAAEKLYSLAGDWADLGPDTLLFDVCCGTGTIGLSLAHRVGMVVGIEMNASAVLDAQRNAEINGIKNCKFISAKAEDVMSSLLKEYLDAPLQEESAKIEEINNVKNDKEGMSEHPDKKVDANSCTKDEQMVTKVDVQVADSIKDNGTSEAHEVPVDKNISGSLDNSDEKENGLNQKDRFSEPHETTRTSMQQFKDVVAIVDPPRVGLHPTVIKALRTHPRLRRLVYISCNPESLVANAIELCTPAPEKPERQKRNGGWRNMSSAGLARHRAKSMPNSEPFRPVRAMAVDLFPHTPHCEMVMLLER
ncbi:zinc finger CCCH domain-containing protein 24 [Aristolochia californica]|uniref:zinc finger CCCH domain-containing protein 24 n=1 Tax=Aristolochia californica TaxID=171875 RepID=UPI0035DBD15A